MCPGLITAGSTAPRSHRVPSFHVPPDRRAGGQDQVRELQMHRDVFYSLVSYIQFQSPVPSVIHRDWILHDLTVSE